MGVEDEYTRPGEGVLGLIVLWLAVFALFYAVSQQPAEAQKPRIQADGRVFASEADADNGTFLIESDDDSESIMIAAPPDGYIANWLKGTINRRVIVSVEAE